jgi:hypothetical protein
MLGTSSEQVVMPGTVLTIGQILAQDGSSTSPAYSFGSISSTGLYRDSAYAYAFAVTLGFFTAIEFRSTNGASALLVCDPITVFGWSGSSATSSLDTAIARNAAGVLELNNGTKGVPASAPGLTIPNASSGAGKTFTITGSSAASGSGANGGSINLIPGAKDGAGTDGQFLVGVNGSAAAPAIAFSSDTGCGWRHKATNKWTYCTGGTNDIITLDTNGIDLGNGGAVYSSAGFGFLSVASIGTPGSLGELVAPYDTATGETDGKAGNQNGAIAVNNADSKIYVRTGATWKGAAVAGFCIPKYGSEPPVVDREGPYRGDEDNFDETLCPCCHERMKPGDPITLLGDRNYSDGGLHAYAMHFKCAAASLVEPLLERIKNLETKLGVA